jgi:sensor domain CHASE-containing protein
VYAENHRIPLHEELKEKIDDMNAEETRKRFDEIDRGFVICKNVPQKCALLYHVFLYIFLPKA